MTHRQAAIMIVQQFQGAMDDWGQRMHSLSVCDDRYTTVITDLQGMVLQFPVGGDNDTMINYIIPADVIEQRRQLSKSCLLPQEAGSGIIVVVMEEGRRVQKPLDIFLQSIDVLAGYVQYINQSRWIMANAGIQNLRSTLTSVTASIGERLLRAYPDHIELQASGSDTLVCHTMDEVLALLHKGCACGPHLKYGAEVELDAEEWQAIETQPSKRRIGKKTISLQHIGRDGSGQGEVRAWPTDSWCDLVTGLTRGYIVASSRVDRALKTLEDFKRFIGESGRTQGINTLRFFKDSMRKSPNGVHIHLRNDANTVRALQWLAVYWNQRNEGASNMLSLRGHAGYGGLGSNKTSGICAEGTFIEFRAFNAPHGSTTTIRVAELEELLGLLGVVLEYKIPLPTGSIRYESYEIAREWVTNRVMSHEAYPKREVAHV